MCMEGNLSTVCQACTELQLRYVYFYDGMLYRTWIPFSCENFSELPCKRMLRFDPEQEEREEAATLRQNLKSSDGSTSSKLLIPMGDHLQKRATKNVRSATRTEGM